LTCIKTGCLAYVAEYGEYVYGDAHEYSSVLLIRAVWRGRANHPDLVQFGVTRHITIHQVKDWWDADKTSMGHQSNVISGPFGWTNHGYDGIGDLTLKSALDAVTIPGEPQDV
jgi:hypothetical protein